MAVDVASVSSKPKAVETQLSRGRRPSVLRRFARNPFAVVGMVYIVIIALTTIFAPVISRYDPDRIALGQQLLGPSLDHWMGTDESGRDEFTRVLYGARISLLIGALSMVLSITVGTIVGALAGFFGGVVDALAMRLTDA